jgi:acyl carrier protein
VQQLEKELRRFVIDSFLYGREDKFSNDDSFLELGLIDSTGMLELVGFLEKAHGIKVEDTDLIPENLDSISRLAQYVGRKRQFQRSVKQNLAPEAVCSQ